MANNRQTFQFSGRMQRSTIDLFAVVSIGASGAPTLTEGKGISSIVRDSAGQYTITLQDTYAALLSAHVMIYSGTSAAAAPLSVIEANTISSDGKVTLQFRAIDNSTATDPASGEKLYIGLVLKNTN